MDQAVWAVARGSGIVALLFCTISVALGITVRSGRPVGRLPRFGVVDVHRFASLYAVVLVAMHVGLLLADPYAQLRLVDLVVPFVGNYRPLWQGLGTLAAELMVVLMVTSLLRHRLGLRAFRVVHWVAYLLWPIAFVHALGNGTDAAHGWFLSFAALCALTMAVSLIWRLRADYTEYSTARIGFRR